MKFASTAAATLALMALAAPALAQPAPRYDARREQVIAITMTDDGFVPRRFSLRGGAPYVLRVFNRSGKGHNLTQQAFFRMARVADRDRGYVIDGRISLDPGQGATVHFLAPDTRPGGTYVFTSDVLGDAGKDYKGVFVIR